MFGHFSMRKQGLNWISRQKSRRFVYHCLQKTDSFFSFSLFFPFSTYSPTRTSDRSRRINYVSFHYRINTRSVHALKVCVCTPMCLPGVAQSIDRNIEIARAITALHQYLRETGDFTEFHAADLAIFGSRKVESEIVATCITFDEFSELVHADFPFSFFQDVSLHRGRGRMGISTWPQVDQRPIRDWIVRGTCIKRWILFEQVRFICSRRFTSRKNKRYKIR